ncbi:MULTISPECIES: RNA recognition motif domain-containing protein [Thalassomonas]|uniref:RNA-binding protein n=1 Tax=Thalassomonas actiniarum TaxID=485447 RepID=A0AAE9YPB8_9GAMM|nr:MULTISPECIES: RNA-binding protein [Thalassomonas]WDD98779.1 RNA-binding protein [Thalassomonas actiniarum]
MKSPQVLTVIIVAVVFALIGYFIAGPIGVDPATVAVSIFIGALLAPFISKKEVESSKSDEVKTLYVGNLPYRANEASVRSLFSEYGNVHSVRLMKDKHTGKRRGFGFVEMSERDSEAAISALNDTEFQQRTLKVREAKDRPERTDEAV